MRLRDGERRIERVLPAWRLVWMAAYFPIVSGGLFAKFPPLWFAFVALLLLAIGSSQQVTVTDQRVVSDRPVLSWLPFAGLQEVSREEHALADLDGAWADGNHLLLVSRSGNRFTVGPDLGSSKAAEKLSARVRAALAELRQVKVSVRPRPAVDPQLRAHAQALLRCPYCHDDLTPALAVACGVCATLHHEECYAEYGRCAVLGCRGRRGRVAA